VVVSLLERPLLCKPHQSSFYLFAVLVPATFLGVVMRVTEDEVMRETWALCASLQVSKSPTLVFFSQSHSLIVSTQLHIIMMPSWVLIFHFGDFIFIFVVFGEYSLDEYAFFFS